jgi:ABC-type transport system substrate-binding protein
MRQRIRAGGAVAAGLAVIAALGAAVASPVAAAPNQGAILTVATDNAIGTLDPILSGSDEVQYLANIFRA